MSEVPHVIHHGYVTVRVGTDVGRPGKESTCFKKGSHRYAGVSFFFTIDLSIYRHLFAVFLLVRFHWRRSRSRRRTSAFKREKIKKNGVASNCKQS